jgi:membrane protein involved in colicin uptake
VQTEASREIWPVSRRREEERVEDARGDGLASKHVVGFWEKSSITMAKKKKPASSKEAAKAAKKTKAAKKAEKSTKKKSTVDDLISEEDLVRTIEDFQSISLLCISSKSL